jgi:hypothetical protein
MRRRSGVTIPVPLRLAAGPRGPGQPQGVAQQGDADPSATLLDQGDHDGALAPGRPSSRQAFWGLTGAFARSARPLICGRSTIPPAAAGRRSRPGAVHTSASLRIRRLYLAVEVRRLGFAATPHVLRAYRHRRGRSVSLILAQGGRARAACSIFSRDRISRSARRLSAGAAK